MMKDETQMLAGWLAVRINGWMTGYMSRWVGGWMDEQRVRASLGRRMTVLRQQQEEECGFNWSKPSEQGSPQNPKRSWPVVSGLAITPYIWLYTWGSLIHRASHSLCVSPGHLYANSAPTWNPGPASRLV